MPWQANNNPAGDIRAPAISAVLKRLKLKETSQNESWSKDLRALDLVEVFDQEIRTLQDQSYRLCALVHPDDFPVTSSEDSVYIYPRSHAHFVVALKSCERIQRGCIGLSTAQLINFELCAQQVETWSLFNEKIPMANTISLEIRPVKPICGADPVVLEGAKFLAVFGKFVWQRVLAENERLSIFFPPNDPNAIEYFIRVTEVQADDENETEFTMPDSFRGLVDEDTMFYLSMDGTKQTFGGKFDLVDVMPKPKNASGTYRSDIVEVITSDEEEFPVKKKLLFPCIKLTSAVLSGKGIYKGSSSRIQVDVDCCTFDRVLLYLEHEARQEVPEEFHFDPSYAEELLVAAIKLGCIGLQEVCKQRLGEFDTRVRKDPIRWEEVVRRNTNGEIWLVMDGMVFDVTRWLPEHPGGSLIIPREAVNVDCTIMFEIYHASRQSFRYLKQFYIGEILLEDRPLIPKSIETPSAGFLEELRQYTTWRLQPTKFNIPTFKSF
jgi:cytochrome b involved in lipid metabolism